MYGGKMSRNDIANRYFNWLCDIACGNRFSPHVSYVRLLRSLHNIDFKYIIAKDQNRYFDGLDLRSRFLYTTSQTDVHHTLSGGCSVLEMITALAIRCEETIMDDPGIGDRTGQWFWGMIVNLGLGGMTDDRFDEGLVCEIIDRFLNRDYAPDGTGGLFTITNCNKDLRTVEIWNQMCWYLDSIT